MDRDIERAEFLPKTNQVQLSWKNSFTDVAFQNATYDYAMIAVPFSKVRSWRFPNTCMLLRYQRQSSVLLNEGSV